MAGSARCRRCAEQLIDLLPVIVASGIVVAAWALIAQSDLRFTGALVIELRDFASAAALAAQAFGPPAVTVAAVYGVLMLLLGAGAAHLIAARRSGAGSAAQRRRLS